jgi:hypothetical protein
MICYSFCPFSMIEFLTLCFPFLPLLICNPQLDSACTLFRIPLMNLLLCYLDLLTVNELLTSCFLSIVITTVMLDLYDQAGALMIVGVLGTRATLASKLVQNLIFFVARSAQHDASESVDLPWLRVSVMALISLVQVWIQLLVIHILRKFAM